MHTFIGLAVNVPDIHTQVWLHFIFTIPVLSPFEYFAHEDAYYSSDYRRCNDFHLSIPPNVPRDIFIIVVPDIAYVACFRSNRLMIRVDSEVEFVGAHV